MTKTVVDNLYNIRIKNFGVANKKIIVYQEKYKKKYDKRNKVKCFKKTFRRGNLVQYRKHKSKKAKGAKTSLTWFPRNSCCKIYSIDTDRCHVILQDRKTKKILPKTVHFEYIRRFPRK